MNIGRFSNIWTFLFFMKPTFVGQAKTCQGQSYGLVVKGGDS